MYRIKKKPEDFVVNEITNIRLNDKGVYSVFLLKKRDYTTERAVQTIANKLGIPRKFISYAGNKDKIAVTTQYISIKNSRIKELELTDIFLEFKGYLDNPILLGDLEGNEFVIKVITDRKPKKIAKMINYFGEQRFSKNNKEIGKLIIKRDFKKAVDLIIKNNERLVEEYLSKKPTDYIGALRKIPLKILKLYVHSYQSYLWNEMVTKCNTKTLPIIGFGTEVTENIKGILNKEGITTRDFIIKQIPELSSEGNERDVFVDIKNLEIEKIEKGYILKFMLSKGSYATEAIKQIFPE
ncbi:hypothetical protein CEE44_03305 [Candidatus Woesearchaeota archaeon B3_Woes]|nr:MAG: hypothetical protein CEE44_03305 [Candidatus Woesearchaeota archaeon B3_Woes]